jgi:protein SCO1/2
MNETAKPRNLHHLWLPALLGALGVLAVPACSPKAAQEPPLKGAHIGGPFALTDQDGRAVTDRSYAGRYRIVYFGFTHCPDVCPTDLASIGQGLARFEKSDPARAAKVQPLFITVDPARDTPAVIKEYVAAFHPRLVGLTGTEQQIAAAAKSYGIYFGKGAVQPGGGYAVDHSRTALLMGPDGAPIAVLPQEGGGAAIAAELEKWVR